MRGKLSRADIRHLHELAVMKDKGVLTAAEFAHEKSAVLESAGHGSVPKRSAGPWLIAAVAALLMVGVAVVVGSARSSANQPAEASNQ